MWPGWVGGQRALCQLVWGAHLGSLVVAWAKKCRTFAFRQHAKPHLAHRSSGLPAYLLLYLTVSPFQYTPGYMIKVDVKEGESIERALRRYKKKFERLGIMKKVRKRMYYTKPSVAKREAEKKAVNRQRYMEAMED